MILSLFRKDPRWDDARALYARAAEQARAPEFFRDLGVADSVEGRFELLSVHVFLVLARLKGEPAPAGDVAQRVVDQLFSGLDAALREMGVGDLSVARKIRGLAESFYGRVKAYEEALRQIDENDRTALASALARNVYETDDLARAEALAGYVARAAAALTDQPTPRLLSGIIEFPPAASTDAPADV